MWTKLFRSKSKKSCTTTTNKSKSFLCRNRNKNSEADVEDKRLGCDIASASVATVREEAELDPMPSNEPLQECHICKRKFVPDTFVKHIHICEKMASKKRKPFDSSLQRREGTELANFLPLPDHSHALPKPKLSSSIDDRITVPVRVGSIRRRSEPTKLAPINHRQHELSAARAIKRHMAPVSEQCPHCERYFGIKAYDRHVEWCKEKARIAQQTITSMTATAKERLEARTKYKAPTVRSKRDITKEKYSGSERGSNRNSEEREYNMFKSESMNSSFSSKGDMSDKYDPFMSAKRQMEELFMPSANYTSSTAQRSTLPNSTSGVGTMSTSLTGPSSTTVTPKTSATNATNQFRRTASLRVPKKKISKPLLTLPSMTKPSTIQRGISVEGPVSSSFLKPEEYDELPVKCHTIVSPKLAPAKAASPQRELGRRHLTPPESARSRATANYNVLKADSLATFLQYEAEISNETPCLSEKERKDKSNSLNRQTLFQQSLHDINENRTLRTESPSLPAQQPQSLPSPPPPPPPPLSSQPQRSSPQTQSSNDNSPERTMPSQEAINSNLSSPSSEYNYMFVDPKLINSCDNLNIDETATISVTDSNGNKHIDDDLNFANLVGKYDPQAPQQRSSVEKRSLKRHLKLNKENFLYDNAMPNKDHLCEFNDDRKNDNDGKEMHGNVTVTDGIEAMFHDFDFEEFISSFEDDDKYPIFKGYKELMSNRSNMQQNRDTVLKNFNELRLDDEILDFNCVADQLTPIAIGSFTNDDRNAPRLRSGSSSVDERNNRTDTNASSSQNMFTFTRNDTAKSNADSAYSSLSRYTNPLVDVPVDHLPALRQHLHRNAAFNGADKSPSPVTLSPLIASSTPKTPNASYSFSSSDSESSSAGPGQRSGGSNQRLSKFCHSCGNRFMLNHAKFCMECGAKRIAFK